MWKFKFKSYFICFCRLTDFVANFNKRKIQKTDKLSDNKHVLVQ